MRTTVRGRHPRRWVVTACLLFVALSCIPGKIYAQASRIRFDHITLEQGLSQSTVYAILQDSRGFMWFGTQDGLNRYDGYGIVIYKHDPDDPKSLPHNHVRAMVEDPQGNIWIATEGGGVAMWDWRRDEFVTYRSEPQTSGSLQSDRISSVALDDNGGVWIGTLDAGLGRLDPVTGRVVTYRHDPSNPASLHNDQIFALHVDGTGTVWVGTYAGLSRFDPVARAFVPVGVEAAGAPGRQARVRTIFEDSSGTLWIGTYGGLAKLDRSTETLHRYRHDPADPSSLAGNRVYSILEDRGGALWIGTNGGLNRFDPRSGSFVVYLNDPSDPTSLGHNVVMSLHQDRGSVIWIGTQGGGLSRWNPVTASFRHYKRDPRTSGLSSDTITSFSQDPAGGLWVGTFGDGLNRRDRSSGAYTVYRADPADPHSLSDDRVMSLTHDHEGLLWIGTMEGGLNRFDPATETFTIFKNEPGNETSLSSNGIMSLFVDHLGDLWVGTYGGGLNRFDRASETFTRFGHDSAKATSLSDDIVTSITEDTSGRLWVGTERGGLNRFDRASGNFVAYRNDPTIATSLSSDFVMSLRVSAGVLWIGTKGGGLNGLELGEASAPASAVFRRFSQRSGLPNDDVHGIESDDAGNLWLSTNNGLSRFDPLSATFKNYDVTDGLQSNEFNAGAHYRSPQGEIFVGGFNGFNAFYPDQVTTNAHVPPVVITSFRKFNKPVDLEQPLSELREIELSYRDSVVSFEVAALDYAAPAKNRYAYRLEGFSDDWIDLGPVRRMTFTNLDAGSYVLRVRGSNNDGVWNDDGVTLGIVVTPPPWATWWAFCIYALLLIYAIAAYLKAQRAKLRREEERAVQLELVVEKRTQQLAVQNQRLEEHSITLAETNDSLEREITERVRTEEALKASEAKYQDLYDNAPDMFATIDGATGTVLQCNRTLADNLGYTEDELLGRHLTELHNVGCMGELQKVLEALRRKQSWQNAELLLEGKDASVIDVSLNVSAVPPASGALSYGRLVWRDITVRKKLEQELRQAQKLKAIGRLAGGVAHEFNNLLAGISGFAHLLLASADDQTSKDDLGQILGCTDRAADLTSQLLGFGRGQPHTPVVLDLAEHLRHAVTALKPIVGEGIEVTVNESQDLGLVKADPKQIDQILARMARNSRDAMPEGGQITIDAVNATVEGDEGMPAGEYVVLSFSDTGHGMEPATLERVFEPFFSTKEQGQGTGLGLSMVYGIVKQHGGHVRAISEVGKGTQFNIYLPVRVEERQEEGASIMEDQTSQKPEGLGTILVVEDEEPVRLMLERLLSGEGYRVLSADHPNKAEQLIEECMDEVELVLTDVIMPGCSGPQLCDRLSARYPSLKFLFMSGYTAERFREEGLLPPDAPFIAKPFSPAELQIKIGEVMQGRRYSAAGSSAAA